MDDSQMDRENLNEDVERMQALWINEMVRVRPLSANAAGSVVSREEHYPIL